MEKCIRRLGTHNLKWWDFQEIQGLIVGKDALQNHILFALGPNRKAFEADI